MSDGVGPGEHGAWPAHGWLAVAACAVASVAGLWWGWDRGALPEVSRYRDDAYYYFEWARNLAEGRGPVVSAGTRTSGVHLLWGLLLTGMHALEADLVDAARALGVAIHAATACAVAAAIPRAPRWFGVCLGLLYLGQPFLLREAQNGQETALACAALAAVWLCRRSSMLVFGAVAAAAVLARSDLFFVVLALSIWREAAAIFGSGPFVGRVICVATVPILALVPYAVANLVLAGSPMQDSATPIPWLMNANFVATMPDGAEWMRRVWWLGRPCMLGWPWTLGSAVLPGLWVVLALPVLHRFGRWGFALTIALACALGLDGSAALWAVAVLLLLEPLDWRRPPMGDLGALLWGVGLVVVIHFVVRAYPRPYYFAPGVAAGFLALRRLGPRAWPLLLVVAAEQGWRATRPPEVMAWQEEMSMAGRFVDRFVPAEAPLGCFNSGLVSWYRSGPVHNLDGVVDRPAFEALRRGEQVRHWDACGIVWLVDNPSQFSRDPGLLHASGRWVSPDFDRDRDLVEVARFVAPGGDAKRPETDDFRLYRRRVGAPDPDAAPAASAPAASAPAFADLGAAADGGRYVMWRGDAGARLWLEPDGAGDAEALATAVPGVHLVLKVAPRGGAWRLRDDDGRVLATLSL